MTTLHPARPFSAVACRATVALAIALSIVALSADRASAQQALTPDQAAAMLLDSARRGFNERNYPFAADRFRQFIQMYGGHKDIASARYGLGLSILLGPPGAPPGVNLQPGMDRDYNGAADVLKQAAGVGDFPQRAQAMYYTGVAHRTMAQLSLAQFAAKPQEQQWQNNATSYFQQAQAQFAEAGKLFTAAAAKFPPPPADVPALPDDVEWSARCRCDNAEMLLRLNKPAEAATEVEPLTADAALARSRYRDLGRYYFGYAKFVAGDYLLAGRTLSTLTPFKDPAFGVHAQYLLARTHHQAGEPTEAAGLYESLLKDYEQQLAAAKQALANPAAVPGLVNNTPEKLRLEAFVASPPQYVPRALFYWGVLLYEQNRYADAAERFTRVVQQFATSPIVPEAQLRLGFCQVQTRQYAEAIKQLTALQDHPTLTDQARWWLARAIDGNVDPNNPPAVQQATNNAIGQLREAANRAAQRGNTEPEAKVRRADMLLELATLQQRLGQHREAADTCQIVINEKADDTRAAAATERRATALHLAGAFPESDSVCQQFVQAWPKSPLLSAVMFRFAENAFAVAEAAAKDPNLSKQPEQLAPRYAEAVKRYTQLLEKYPEFDQQNRAFYAIAISHYRTGQLNESIEQLKRIPDAERTGELKGVPILLADCLIRTAPASATDALAAGRLLQQISEAAKLLEGYIAGNPPEDPELPGAMIKLGHCQQVMASILADQGERNAALNTARTLYEQFKGKYPNHALLPIAEYERAECFAALGDIGNAIERFGRFANDPLRQAPIAPMALLRQAALMRAQNRSAEAVNVLVACRQQHEGAIMGDPQRAAWAPLIQYHQGLALKESGKLPEARGEFENLMQRFPNAPEALEAAWRAGQCRKLIVQPQYDAAMAILSHPDATPDQRNAANGQMQEVLKQLAEIAQFLEQQAGVAAQKAPGSEAHQRLLYETAWCHRLIGQQQVAQAIAAKQAEAVQRLQTAAAQAAPGQPAAPVNAPVIELSTIPVQPAQQKALDLYKALIAASAESTLSMTSRLEAAEMYAMRESHDEAIPLLLEAIDLEPPAEIAEKLHLRLGSSLLAKNDAQAAAEQFVAVTQSADVARAAEARYRTAEALMFDKNLDEAIKQLVPFRDQGPLQNIAGVSDRAVLRLGHAYAYAGQWDASRQAMETLINRYGSSPWRDAARYGIAWAFQNQRNWDAAIQNYQQVTRATGAEVAARAQLQVGLCLIEKMQFAEAANALLVVPFTYDYPQWSAAALCEAARAFISLNQPDQAKALLNRVIKDHADTEWGPIAQERLKTLTDAK